MSSTPGRNDPCHCGSGKKYKHCCQRKGGSTSAPMSTSRTAMIVVAAVILVGLVLVGLSLTVGGGGSDCPPGTVWSAAHQHCH